jgi:aspartyl-tRNA(Asn)/glutamyl-tRNA(Gln) amidotransferase subunit B
VTPRSLANVEGESLETYASDRGVTPSTVAELDGLVQSGRLNDSMARQVLEGVLAGEGSPTEVADGRGLELAQDDTALEAAVDQVIAANPDVAQKVRDGKVQAAGALIGQVMKELKGQADAGKARELILSRLT